MMFVIRNISLFLLFSTTTEGLLLSKNRNDGSFTLEELSKKKTEEEQSNTDLFIEAIHKQAYDTLKAKYVDTPLNDLRVTLGLMSESFQDLELGGKAYKDLSNKEKKEGLQRILFGTTLQQQTSESGLETNFENLLSGTPTKVFDTAQAHFESDGTGLSLIGLEQYALLRLIKGDNSNIVNSIKAISTAGEAFLTAEKELGILSSFIERELLNIPKNIETMGVELTKSLSADNLIGDITPTIDPAALAQDAEIVSMGMGAWIDGLESKIDSEWTSFVQVDGFAVVNDITKDGFGLVTAPAKYALNKIIKNKIQKLVKEKKFSQKAGERFAIAYDIFNDGFLGSLNTQFATKLGSGVANHFGLIDPSTTVVTTHTPTLAQTFLNHMIHKVASNHGVDMVAHGAHALTHAANLTHTIHVVGNLVATGIACGTGAITLGVLGTAVAHMLVVAVPFHIVKHLVMWKWNQWKEEELRIQEQYKAKQLQLAHSDFDFIEAQQNNIKLMAEDYEYMSNSFLAANHPFKALYEEHCKDENCKESFQRLADEYRQEMQRIEDEKVNIENEKAAEYLNADFLGARCPDC